MNCNKENLDRILLKRFTNHLEKEYSISCSLKSELLLHARIQYLSDKEVLIQQGSYCNKLYFVVSGLLIFYNSNTGENVVSGFCKSGDCAAPLSGMYGSTPTTDHVCASGETVVIAFEAVRVEQWYAKYAEANVIMRKVFERYLGIAHGRSIIMRMKTAQQKYDFYKQERPEYLKYVPIEALASFFCVTVATLAKVIKEDNKKEIQRIDQRMQLAELTALMERDKLYLNPDVSISAVADILSITSHTLSRLINSETHMNFSTFIAKYRVAHASHLLKDHSSWKHLKLETVGLQAGFRSRSSFFSVFKTLVGMTPLQFIETSKF